MGFEGELYSKSVEITANSECDKCNGIFVRDGEELYRKGKEVKQKPRLGYLLGNTRVDIQ